MTVMLSAHNTITVRSISSTGCGRLISRHYICLWLAPGELPLLAAGCQAAHQLGSFAEMADPTFDDIDALVGPATPHFAFQIRARVRDVVSDLSPDHPVRRYGEEKVSLLERLGHASSKAEDSPRESRERIGWDEIPSAAPAYDPLHPDAEVE